MYVTKTVDSVIHARSDWPLKNPMQFTSERRQTRGVGFPVCYRNKGRNFLK